MLRKENIEKHFDVVRSCLMELPEEYLDMAEFGEHNEFNVRIEYIQSNETRLGKEGRKGVISRCDMKEFGSNELRKVQEFNLFEAEEMIELCIKVVEKMEKEREEDKKRMEEMKKEMERMNEKLKGVEPIAEKLKEEALKKGGYLLEKNPEMKKKTEVRGTHGDLKALCELLKGNVIPTMKLYLGRELI